MRVDNGRAVVFNSFNLGERQRIKGNHCVVEEQKTLIVCL